MSLGGAGLWRAPKKEIVGIRREAAVLKQPEQVVVLPVNVAHDLDRRLKL
jgi:hypothetical protein